jgi:hypothetical protein
MSAEDLRAKLSATDTDLKVAHAVAISNLNRITQAIQTLQSIDSNSPDIAIALQGLQKLEQDMVDSINVMILTIRDLDNYRWTL